MGLMDLFRKKTSGDIAKDRLKLLLVSDRASCSPEIMEQIKNDIIEVISKYMDIDPQGLDIQITETESESGNGVVPAPEKALRCRCGQCSGFPYTFPSMPAVFPAMGTIHTEAGIFCCVFAFYKKENCGASQLRTAALFFPIRYCRTRSIPACRCGSRPSGRPNQR